MFRFSGGKHRTFNTQSSTTAALRFKVYSNCGVTVVVTAAFTSIAAQTIFDAGTSGPDSRLKLTMTSAGQLKFTVRGGASPDKEFSGTSSYNVVVNTLLVIICRFSYGTNLIQVFVNNVDVTDAANMAAEHVKVWFLGDFAPFVTLNSSEHETGMPVMVVASDSLFGEP